MTTVRVKRPHEVATFLREHPAEERHRLSNHLMLLGLQQLKLAEVARLLEAEDKSSIQRRREVALSVRNAQEDARRQHVHIHLRKHSGSPRRVLIGNGPTKNHGSVFGEVVEYQSPSVSRRTAAAARVPSTRAWFCSLDGAPADEIPAANPKLNRGVGRVGEHQRQSVRPTAVVTDDYEITTSPRDAATSEEANLLSPSTRTPEESPKSNSAFYRVPNGGAKAFMVDQVQQDVELGVTRAPMTEPVPIPPPFSRPFEEGQRETLHIQRPSDGNSGLIELHPAEMAMLAASIESGSTTRMRSQTSQSPSLVSGPRTARRFAGLDTIFCHAGLRPLAASASRQSSLQTTPSIQPVVTVASSPFSEQSPSSALKSLSMDVVDSKLRYFIERTRGARRPLTEVIATLGIDAAANSVDLVGRYGDLLVDFHRGHALSRTM